jgi:hypothetical protein
MRAAVRTGARALHVYVDKRLILSWDDAERVEFGANSHYHEIRSQITDMLGHDRIVGLTGLGAAPLRKGPLRLVNNLHELPGVCWLYDVYDDLTFNSAGRERVERLLADAFWRCRCERSIVLDPGLQEKYTGSYHLNNASHLAYLPSVAKVDTRNMVFIGSIDSRLDLRWLEALTTFDVTVSIFGSIHDTAPEIGKQLDNLLHSRRNILFRGPYDNDQLDSILSGFQVGLLPYRVGHPMTEHVNPDKLYHYLNAGLDVLASPIPAARRLEPHLHLIAFDGDWAKVLHAVTQSPTRQQNWPREAFSWHDRWLELVKLTSRD